MNQHSEQDQVEKLRGILVREIDLFLASGGKLVQGSWGNEAENCACALNAACLNRGLPIHDSGEIKRFYLSEFGFDFWIDNSNSILGAFLQGFDERRTVSLEESLEDPDFDHSFYQQVYQLGQEIKNKYLEKNNAIF